MVRLLTNREFVDGYGERLRALCAAAGHPLVPVVLPLDSAERLPAATLTEIEVACFTGNFEDDPAFTRRFLGSALRAANLRWMHLPNAGVDDPVFERLMGQGVRLTTSSGVAAAPIAQAVIAAVLMLARGFPRWLAAQRVRRWEPHPPAAPPRDLQGQTLLLIGVGAIGAEIARLARAVGVQVVGVRRRPRTPVDPVDELHPPEALGALLPRADWLVVACPLTDSTRGLIDAAALARLPRGAHVINVARGAIIDEPALIAALQRGHVGGAYLDVFASEPLPSESPLWELPNVLVSPHDSATSGGNAARVSELFLENLDRWFRGAALRNEVAAVSQSG